MFRQVPFIHDAYSFITQLLDIIMKAPIEKVHGQNISHYITCLGVKYYVHRPTVIENSDVGDDGNYHFGKGYVAKHQKPPYLNLSLT